ncbi:unnamed protein product [Vitrella brassicaformis CCMP3155]|uniref:Thiaminase-2/PQQC domain-containing protein n=1 Tax=Vitrella brassicaformis (strain CCMP3155) TaxID=1169540 RepID=A0A0G4ECI9_VITBC|nr:unnamed protein product [Vitrella brassicaformis CCMP3155]|mmetsp:Transcript_768/g.1646  ORF Transcript_768/g.1646 Transcript_768/m.1646 type:complete len:222 (-) Transcript_768:80-745(-)|eukprot:CEL93688.1 unnamed protein product [Vitrella brassicaformis CCMP3155]
MADFGAAELERAAGADWKRATHHPFIEGIGGGTLPQEKFKIYLMQDYIFLESFARLIARIIAAAPAMPQISKLSSFLAVITSEENDYFLRSFAALGSSESEAGKATPSPTMQKMLDAFARAEGEGYHSMIAALFCAEWVYHSWGVRLAATEKPPASLPFYFHEWIGLHSNDGFRAFVSWLYGEVDRTAKECSGTAAEAQMRQVFVELVKLEGDFWDECFGQ